MNVLSKYDGDYPFLSNHKKSDSSFGKIVIF